MCYHKKRFQKENNAMLSSTYSYKCLNFSQYIELNEKIL
nr:MAG TPA: hypothetical protein [Caudoviricetes sp.]DAY56481.1 MAG TPA: hypothetical protein [Caudoviricetes sp.]